MLIADDLAPLRSAGATARAAGEPETRNPYYLPQNMPAATLEPVEDWTRKAEAWRIGWLIEDAMRAR